MQNDKNDKRQKLLGIKEAEKIKVLCQLCKNFTTHQILKSVTERGVTHLNNYPEESYHWETDFEIIECLGCETISFRLLNSNSEDYDNDGPAQNENLYPERISDVYIKEEFVHVPNYLLNLFVETVGCFNRDYHTL